MAHWFYQIFLWYGLLTQYQQINCFRNSRLRAPSAEKVLEFALRHNKSNIDVQRKKGFVGVTHSRSNFQRTVNADFAIPSAAIHVPQRNQFLRKPAIIKSKLKKRQNIITSNGSQSKFQGLRRLSYPTKEQVPDDDFEGDERDHSAENDDLLPQPTTKLPNYERYYFRNGKRTLVRIHLEESDKHYQQVLNKYAGNEEGLMIDNQQNGEQGLQQRMEAHLHMADAFENLGNSGPVFKNSMLWVNALRANRGWFPKGTSD